MIDAAVLRNIPLFASLPPEAIDLLAAQLRVNEYPAQTVLFQEGDAGDRFYIVAKGHIAVIKASGTAEEHLLTLRGPGEFVGELGLINPDGLRTACARIETDAHLLELDRRDFDKLVRSFPELAYGLLRTVSMRLSASDDAAISFLQEKNRQLAHAYLELKAAQERLIEQEALERELNQAREIQRNMLPTELPGIAGLSIGARMTPAHMVGGDFYDIFQLDDTHVALAVGDVSGKGIPAALFMALVSNLLRAEAARAASPADALHALNRHLLARNPSNMFVTVIYGVLDVATREFSFARAGHEAPLLWDAQGEPIAVEFGRGMPIGLFHNPILDIQTICLATGSTLLLYSDGVTEALDEEANLFGREQLRTLPFAHRSHSAQEFCAELVRTLDGHRGRAAQADDITMLAVRVELDDIEPATV